MPSRRTLLRALGVGTVPFAGCSARTDAPARTGTGTPTTAEETPTDTPVESPGDTPTETPDDACETAWTAETRWTFERSGLDTPIVTADELLVPSDGDLFALDPDDGSVRSELSIPGDHVYGLADGVLLVSDGDRLLVVGADDGEVAWTFEPPGEYARRSRTMPVRDGTVYVGAAAVPTPEQPVDDPYGRLYGLDLATGERVFVRDLTAEGGNWVDPRYVLAGDAGVFVTRESGGVIGLDHDGTVRWRRSGDDWYYRPVLAGDLVLQPTSRTVVALDAASGKTQWRDDGPEMHVAAADGVAYGAGGGGLDEDGVLAALDAETGRYLWETQIEGCGHRPVVGAGVVAIGVGCRAGSGHVGLFDAASGCRYGQYDQSADLSPALAVGAGRLYAVDGENREKILAFDHP